SAVVMVGIGREPRGSRRHSALAGLCRGQVRAGQSSRAGPLSREERLRFSDPALTRNLRQLEYWPAEFLAQERERVGCAIEGLFPRIARTVAGARFHLS